MTTHDHLNEHSFCDFTLHFCQISSTMMFPARFVLALCLMFGGGDAFAPAPRASMRRAAAPPAARATDSSDDSWRVATAALGVSAALLAAATGAPGAALADGSTKTFNLPPVDIADKSRCQFVSSKMGQSNGARDKLYDLRQVRKWSQNSRIVLVRTRTVSSSALHQGAVYKLLYVVVVSSSERARRRRCFRNDASETMLPKRCFQRCFRNDASETTACVQILFSREEEPVAARAERRRTAPEPRRAGWARER
jgi:hypothetical protein